MFSFERYRFFKYVTYVVYDMLYEYVVYDFTEENQLLIVK